MWSADALYVTSNPSSIKSRNLDRDPRCSLAANIGDAHIVIEGDAARTSEPAEIERIAAIMRAGGWPAEVNGDHLDAPFGAPTSGGPPYAVYRITARRGYAFAADGETFAPTRWTFVSPA